MPTAMEILAEVSEFPASAAPDIEGLGGERRAGASYLRTQAFLDVALSLPVLLVAGWTVLKLR